MMGVLSAISPRPGVSPACPGELGCLVLLYPTRDMGPELSSLQVRKVARDEKHPIKNAVENREMEKL